MEIVVADTSPIFYLLFIEQIDLLPKLFGTVVIPDAVYKELRHPTAPPWLRRWADEKPKWLKVVLVSPIENDVLRTLGAGERAAISLAMSLNSKLILVDERKGAKAALARGFDVTGTLGILRIAAQRNLVNLADSFERLKKTNFRYRQETMDALLKEHGEG